MSTTSTRWVLENAYVKIDVWLDKFIHEHIQLKVQAARVQGEMKVGCLRLVGQSYVDIGMEI